MERRALITALGLAGLAAAGTAAANTSRDRLVVIFLRGGADGLSMLPPYLESEYYRLRPKLAVPAPGEANGALDLDGQFGLHPAMAALKPAYDSGELAFIPAAGLDISTRSHFEMQALIEQGAPGSRLGNGWLGRHLANLTDNVSPVKAVCLDRTLAASMRGDPSVAVLPQLNAFQWLSQIPSSYFNTLEQLQQAGSPFGFADTAGSARTLMETLDSTRPWNTTVAATYPDNSFGRALKQLAQLIKADLGTEIAHIDARGWDTHHGQSSRLPALLSGLANSLAAFRNDLGGLMSSTTVIVMSEFGRRLAESGDGTAHGSGGCMLAMGAGVNGGRVHGQWPGLQPADLDDGDVPVTTDYRQILGEFLTLRQGVTDLSAIFPGFTPGQSSGVFAAA